MALDTRLAAVVSAIGASVKALRTDKADDTTVVHRSGTETITGTKTFGSSPVVPTPSAAAHPVRHDDGRWTVLAGKGTALSGWAQAYPGVSDLQALVDGFGPSGGVLHLERDQTYTLSAALTVPDFLTIEGNGAHIVQSTAGADGIAGVDATGLCLRNLTIRRSAPQNGTGKGIRLTRSVNAATVGLMFDNVEVRGFGSDGIDLSNPIVSAFRSVTARSNAGHGWNVHGVPDGAAGTSCRFDTCYADQNLQSGFRLENMVYTGLGACAADLNGINYELIDCQSVELAASGCETPVNRSAGYPGHNVVVRGGFGIVLDALWTYESLTTSLWITDTARGVVIRSMAENSPKAEATHCILVDAGCRVTIEDCNNVRPYSLAGGTTSILNDGGGLSIPGYVYGGDSAYFEAEVATGAGDPSWDGALTPRGWVNTQLAGKAASSHTHPASAVTAAPRTVAYGSALTGLTPASGVAVDVVTCTLTGNPTITPAAGTDGQVIRLRLLAGGSARTATIASAVRLGTGITVRTLAITSGQAGVFGLEYVAGLSAWVLFSAYATSS